MPHPARILRPAALAAALLLPLAACGTEDISNAKQERYFARAESEEGRVRNFVARYNWAKAKHEEYGELVADAEAELSELRTALVEARRLNDQRARELKALADEAATLDANIAAQTAARDQKQAAIKASQEQIAALQTQQTTLEGQRKALADEVGALQSSVPRARTELHHVKRLLKIP
ncbi:MAG: hypothetical protein R3F20_10365 [Planctomycetota bacterium]